MKYIKWLITNLRRPSPILVGFVHTTIWVGFVLLFCFGYFIPEFISPINPDNISESVKVVFLSEFSNWATFVTMLGILAFLLYDYFININSGTRDHKNRICYPAQITMLSIVTASFSVIIFLSSANIVHNNIFGFKSFFNTIGLPVTLFLLYLALLWYLRFVTVHETRIIRNMLKAISSHGGANLEWIED